MAKAKLTPDALIANAIKVRQKKHGHAYRTEEHEDHTFILPIPAKAIAFMWVIGGLNGLPLGRVMGVSGEYASFKSTLLAEVGNWFLTENGVDLNIDTEQKTSATMYQAVRSTVPEVDRERGLHEQAMSVDDWQTIALDFVKQWSEDDVRELGPGQRIPLRIGIDSLVGKEGKEEQEKLLQEGAASERGYATINNKIKKFFAGLDLSGLPVLLTYVTHLKEELDSGRPSYMGKKMKELGGTSPGFYATLVLRCNRGPSIRKTNDEGELVEGYVLKISCHKTSAGPDGRYIEVPYVWKYVEDEDELSGFRQVGWFDWEWALGRLLWRYLYDPKFTLAAERHRFKELFPIVGNGGSKSSPKYQESKTAENRLFPDEDGPLDLELLGRRVIEDKELFNKVRKMLRIFTFPSVQEVEAISHRHGGK